VEVDDDDSDGGGVDDMDRAERAGLVGGAINIKSLRSVVIVGGGVIIVDRDKGLDCGGGCARVARCFSNRRCLRLSSSSASSIALRRLSSDACLARAAVETFLDLPRRCEGGGGFWYQVLRGGKLAASI